MLRSPNLLRDRGDAKAPVTQIELFFDLVFVFGVTQVSHFLLKHLDLAGVVEAALLFAALWWVWNYTAWVTNWLEPQCRPVRGALLAVMFAGLALSASLPQAFGSRGAVFACAYVAMQLGRTLFMLWAVRGAPDHVRNFQRIAWWTVLSGLLWLAGGFAAPQARLAWWGGALAIDLISPMLAFWTPILGRADTTGWNVEASHFAERCALFVLIALGESLVVIGATFANAPWDAATFAGFCSTFIGAAALWWIYFDTAAESTRRAFEAADDRGATARIAYTYLHAVLIAGIIVVAVGDELVLAHPHLQSDTTAIACIVGGPALYLIGNAAFRRSLRLRLPNSHLIGLALLGLIAIVGHAFDRLSLGVLVADVLVFVAVAGTVLHARRARQTRATSITGA
jgi:low temperature requirement protein LtrA